MCVETGTAIAIAGLAASAASTGAALASQANQAEAARQQAAYQAQVAQNNAALAQQQGEVAQQQIYREGAQRAAAQRATMAANGIDLGFGTAVDIQQDTARATALDAATAQYNAFLQGTSLRDQATLDRTAGRNAAAAAPAAMAGTLLAGASQFSSRWNAWAPTSSAGAGIQPGPMTGGYTASNWNTPGV